MAIIEVIPLVASTTPVIVGCSVISTVVSVLGLLVESTGLGVLDESLSVEVARLLAVEDGAHLINSRSQKIAEYHVKKNSQWATIRRQSKNKNAIVKR